MASRTRFAWWGTLLFFVVGLLRVWHHEPWRDECGVWLLALNTSSVAGFLHMVHYGGHPYLWPILAWLPALFTSQFFGLQVLHVSLASTAAFLILRYAPWRRWEAVLCVLGYFVFFEYAIICRAYVLALLGIVLVCIAWEQRASRPWLGGAGLLLLTQSSVFGIILALALVPLLMIVGWQRSREGTLSARWCAGWGLPLLLGGVVSLAMIIPPADSGHAREWLWTFDPQRLATVGSACWGAIVPLPDPATPFPWNSNITDSLELAPQTRGILGGLLLLCILILLCRSGLPLLYFLLATLGTCLFMYIKYPGYLRHHGHIYLALLAAVWLISLNRSTDKTHFTDYIRRGWFVLQAVAAIWLSIVDWRQPFSANRQTAEWIASSPYADAMLAADPPHPGTGVAMHLRQPIYFLARESWGTFMVWDNHGRPITGVEDLFQRARALSDRHGRPVLVILSYEMPEVEGFRKVAQLTDSLVWGERFYVYAR